MAEMIPHSMNPDATPAAADPEVTAKAKRRRFLVQDKLRILREAYAPDGSDA